MKFIIVSIVCVTLAACTTARPGPEVFSNAENAIKTAEAVGGNEFAPTEMRFAREKLATAHQGIEKQKYDIALYLLEQSEINAELAIEKSRTAKSRRLASELRKSNEELKSKLQATFGAEFK